MLILIVKLRAKPGQGEKLIELVERAIEPFRETYARYAGLVKTITSEYPC